MHSAVPALVALIVVLAVFGTALWASFHGAPWLPTPTKDIIRMLDLAGLQPGETLYDLGCGDGRVCTIAAERYAIRVVGYEISVLPYLIAQIRRLCSPCRSSLTIVFRDFQSEPLNAADVIFCFLTPPTMRKMKTKFVHECKADVRILSYTFRIEGWKESVFVRPPQTKHNLYLYQLPYRVTG